MTFQNLNFPLSVLLVDDDKNICKTLAMGLEGQNCKVTVSSSVEEAIFALNQKTFDLILSDFRLDQASTALNVIAAAKAAQPTALIVVMTAFSSIENAVQVIREGAYDYLTKPFSNVQLGLILKKVRQIISLSRENHELKAGRVRHDFFSGFSSPASKRLESFVSRIAPSESAVLISGETGTGKSELAKLIHTLSPRADQPFVTVYCTTLTESLVESELFGHVKGSFTGAFKDKIGKLESANGGSLFLDEIGDLPPQSQAKLLRFLHEKVFEPVGGNKEITIDTRIIAATNRDLRKEVEKGTFREDLYYRINAIECKISPLRDRREDIRIFIEQLSQEITSREDFNRPIHWDPDVISKLVHYSWPGNIRELKNALERIFTLAKGRNPALDDFPEAILSPSPQDMDSSEKTVTLEEMEKNYIARVLESETNLERASEILGITSVTLWRKRKQYGLE
jgi:DNA-binding NtrC family response regulator